MRDEQRCRACRWAEARFMTPNDSVPHLSLVCTKMAAARWNYEDGKQPPEHPDTLAYVLDMESYSGTEGLWMSPEFGCVMWEPKP